MADDTDLQSLAAAAAERHGLPKKWFISLIGNGEGGFRNPEGVSKKGAKGPGQLMPGTAKEVGVDPDSLSDNIEGSARYAAQLYNKFKGDTVKASAAYNAGPGAVESHHGVPPFNETKAYVKRVGLPSADDLLDAKVLPTADDVLDGKAAVETGDPSKPIVGPTDKASGRKVTSLDPRSKNLRSTPLQRAREQAAEPVRRLPGDIGHEFMGAGRANADVIHKAEARQAETDKRVLSGKPKLTDFLPDYHAITDTAQLAGNALAQVVSPITGAARALVGRPTENVTGSAAAGRVAEDVAGMAAPVAGEARLASEAARIAREEGISTAAARQIAERHAAAPPPPRTNALKGAVSKLASDDPEHIAAVKRLREAGVKPAAHQAAGGSAQRIVESAKSNPYVGEGVRASERAANDSFNRALYNKVLEPLGEKVGDAAPVGNDGVRAVKARMEAAYKEVEPHIRVVGDKNTTDQLAAIRTTAAKLGQPQEAQFEAILNQDVLHHFETGGMDGKTFKKVESDLLRQARGFKGSQDPNQRELGKRLEDVVDVLRQDMIDHSPAKYRAKIEATNAAYARYVRLRDAATRRLGSSGNVSPTDLLAAVKKGDHSVGKGAFATGDALLQDFAKDADRVLSPKVGDSGTTERALANRLIGHGVGAGLGAAAGGAIGGPVGAGAGAAIGAAGDMAASRVTNSLAARMLANAERSTAERNALKAARARPQMRPTPALTAGAMALPQPGNQR